MGHLLRFNVATRCGDCAFEDCSDVALAYQVVIDSGHYFFFLTLVTLAALEAVFFADFVALLVARETACDAAMIGRKTRRECGFCALRFN